MWSKIMHIQNHYTHQHDSRKRYSVYSVNNSNVVSDDKNQSLDDIQRNKLFVKESIPIWVACVGYVFFSIISIIVIPIMFPPLKWYYRPKLFIV